MTTRFLLSLTLSALMAGTALAAPELKVNVLVNADVVTVGDMFAGSGNLAEAALFRAPAPGTSGLVDISAVRMAATKVGLTGFDEMGIDQVRVARQASIVDQKVLTDLIVEDLTNRGILANGIIAETIFDQSIEAVNAAAVDRPAILAQLHYVPGNNTFAARFTVSGLNTPIDVTGRIEMMVDMPHLATSLPTGTVLQAGDIEMRRVPLKYAQSNGFADIGQIVGKALQRQSRAGMVLRPADVAEPLVITRNQDVTVYFRNGPLTLSVKGLALTAASAGETIQVINLLSKRVLTGTAVGNGTVEITSNAINIAGL